MKNNIILYLKILISLSILLSLFYFIDIQDVYQNIVSIGLYNFLILVTISLLLVLIQTLRLHTLIVQYTQTYKKTLELTLIGQFFSSFLPGSISGDFYKVFILKKENVSLAGATSLIALDRFIGLAWVIVFGGIYALFISSNQLQVNISWNIILYTFSVIIIIITIFILFYKKNIIFQKKIKSMVNEIKYDILLISKTQLYAFLFISLGSFFIRVFKFYVLIWMFNQSFDFLDLFLVVFLVQMAGMIPLSIGGLGIVEASLVYSLGLFGLPNSIALSIALLNRISMWLFSILGGFIWIKVKSN